MPFSHPISAAIALAVCLAFWFPVFFRWSINADVFIDYIVKLIDKHELERAIKLNAAAGNALIAQVMKPILHAAQTPMDFPLQSLARITHNELRRAETFLYRWLALGSMGGILTLCSILIGISAQTPSAVGWVLNGLSVLVGLSGVYSTITIRDHIRNMPAPVLSAVLASLDRPHRTEEIVDAVTRG
ncbi:MAG: hypothetical protein AAFV53_15795 [Myxococcota bacterium]